jgi:DNA-binding CsgD family transcriptional regulator
MKANPVEQLTQRQKDCLRRAGRGLTYKEIAVELSIAPETVRVHLKAAMQTLGVSDRRQAARMLAEAENEPNPRWVNPSQAVVDSAKIEATAAPSAHADDRNGGEQALSGQVQEMQAVYRPILGPEQQDRPLRLPFIGGDREDLKAWHIVLLCLMGGLIGLAAIAAVIKVNFEISLSRQIQTAPTTD